MTYRNLSTVMVLAGLLALTPSVASATNDYDGNFEFFAGTYRPDSEAIEADTLFGLRIGKALDQRFELEGTFGVFEGEGSLGAGSRVKTDTMTLDLSGLYRVPVREKIDWLVFAGPGLATGETDIFIGSQREMVSNDSMSLHAGTGARFAISERAHIRPDARLRWYEKTGETDFQATVSAGVRF